MERPEFVDWLRRDSNDVRRAYCRVCRRSFDVKNMGEGAVKSHGAEAKHVANMMQLKQPTRTTNSISTFFMHPTSASARAGRCIYDIEMWEEKPTDTVHDRHHILPVNKFR